MSVPHEFPFNALQKAIFTRLSSDVSGAAVVDDPEGSSYPMVLIGDLRSENTSTSGGSSNSVSVDIDVLSSASRNEQANGLMDDIATSLTTTEIDVSAGGFDARWVNLEAEFRREYDGKETIRHGVVRVTWLVSKI